MTPLPPLVAGESWRVPDGPLVAGPGTRLCAVPGCRNLSVHRHHVVPRSTTFGPKTYLEIESVIILNLANLCFRHHEAVESGVGGCKARIRFLGLSGWGWYERAKRDEKRSTILWYQDGVAWQFKGFLRGVYVYNSSAGECQSAGR